MVTKQEIESSVIVILFGAGFLIYNTQYSPGTLSDPGPGIFPLVIGMVIVILGALQLLPHYRKQQKAACEEKGWGGISVRSLWMCLEKDNPERDVAIMIGVFILYLLAIKWVGFFTSNFLFVMLSCRIVGARDWLRPFALSAGVNIFCYLVFRVWLQIPFPAGILL